MLSSNPAAPDGEDRVRIGLFFALFPPPPVAARIAELAGQLQSVHRLKGSPTAPDRLHCTLHPIKWSKFGLESSIARACRAAEKVRAEPFLVAFNHTGSFAGREKQHFVLRGDNGFAPLIAFRRALGSALYSEELKDGVTNSFTPHVTLLYGGDHAIAEHPIPPLRWRVEAFELIESTHGVGHRHVARWPLRG